MKRAIPAAIVTLLGLLALASFKTSPGLPASAAGATRTKSTTPPATAPPPTPGSTTPSSTTPASTRPASTTPPTNPPATSPPATNATTTRTIDGDPFDNRYGTVQVQVTLQGHQIVGVTPLQMPTDRERSAEISQQAAPLLLQEVLQAQSAQIDIIGGASYTSQGYAQSLQSALDKAGA